MREIGFRVWDKENKKMFDVTHLQYTVLFPNSNVKYPSGFWCVIGNIYENQELYEEKDLRIAGD